MNGRALSDRAIEVSPSSARVLERAAEILTPFPVWSWLNFLISSQARIDLVLEIGRVLPVDSVIFNVVQRVLDVPTLLLLKAPNRNLLGSSTVSHPHFSRHQCRPTCPPHQVKQIKLLVRLQCPEVFLSEQAIGNVDPKDAGIIISQKMFRVYVVEQVVLKQL